MNQPIGGLLSRREILRAGSLGAAGITLALWVTSAVMAIMMGYSVLRQLI